eukprot:scaffold23114_cov80-Skeletonema_marinoi.AAC.2
MRSGSQRVDIKQSNGSEGEEVSEASRRFGSALTCFYHSPILSNESSLDASASVILKSSGLHLIYSSSAATSGSFITYVLSLACVSMGETVTSGGVCSTYCREGGVLLALRAERGHYDVGA